MIKKIIENQNLFDEKIIDKNFFISLNKSNSKFPFAFISTLFTISQFLDFSNKLD